MAAVISDLVGSELIDSSGQPVELPQLPADGALGIYFSAHWCPPCRMFTPQLAEFYRNFKKTEAGSRLEIVFVSSDRDEEEFKKYHAEMPWPALPYADRSRKNQLSKKFKVSGIPTLVFIDPQTGKLITDSGREQVAKHPDGEGFPWKPLPLSELLNNRKLLKGSEEVDSKEALDGKVLGIYFSAHWCPPCRGFTPQLSETYKKLQAAGRNFEIIFVSSDRDENSMKEYFAEMPWLAVPYDDPRRDSLSSYFDISGIPSLILLDEKRDLITDEGRSAIGRDPEGEKFPWFPEPFEELSGENASALNSSACLILLTDKKEDLINQAKQLYGAVAADYRNKVKATKDDPNPVTDLRFFYEGPESENIIERLNQFLQLKTQKDGEDASAATQKPRAWIIDISEERYYDIAQSSDGSDPFAANGEEKLRQLVDDFQNNKIAFKSFQG